MQWGTASITQRRKLAQPWVLLSVLELMKAADPQYVEQLHNQEWEIAHNCRLDYIRECSLFIYLREP